VKMRKAKVLFSVSIVLAIIAIAIAYPLWEYYVASKQLSIKLKSIRPISITKFRIELYAENPSDFDFEISSLKFDVYVNGVYIGQGFGENIVIPRRGRTVVYIEFTIASPQAATLLLKLLQGKELVIKIKGMAEIPLKLLVIKLPLTLSVPFDIEERFP